MRKTGILRGELRSGVCLRIKPSLVFSQIIDNLSVSGYLGNICGLQPLVIFVFYLLCSQQAVLLYLTSLPPNSQHQRRLALFVFCVYIGSEVYQILYNLLSTSQTAYIKILFPFSREPFAPSFFVGNQFFKRVKSPFFTASTASFDGNAANTVEAATTAKSVFFTLSL